MPFLYHVTILIRSYLYLLFLNFTCFGVDREEVLRVASGDSVTQATGCGGEVRVLRLDVDDRHILWRVLHHDWVVDWI